MGFPHNRPVIHFLVWLLLSRTASLRLARAAHQMGTRSQFRERTLDLSIQSPVLATILHKGLRVSSNLFFVRAVNASAIYPESTQGRGLASTSRSSFVSILRQLESL